MVEHFYIVAKEYGHGNRRLPTWTAQSRAHFIFSQCAPEPYRQDLAALPGGFILHDVLSHDECDQFVGITEQLGYHADSPVSLSHDIRHNDNLNWVVDQHIDHTIWSRCKALVPPTTDGQALGLNARFRFYRYRAGDFFKPHTDGAWPGSRVLDRRLQHDAYGDRLSQFSFLLFLSDHYQGGRTLFFTDKGSEAIPLPVKTPKGAALCFPHGSHPWHCLHAGERVEKGTKYIIRTDILYPLARPG